MKSLNFIIVALFTLLMATSCEKEVFVTVPCEEEPVDTEIPTDPSSKPEFPDLAAFNPEYGIPDELVAYGEYYLNYYELDTSEFSDEYETHRAQVATFGVMVFYAQIQLGETVPVNVKVNVEDVIDCLIEASGANAIQEIIDMIESGEIPLEDLAGKVVELIAKKLGGGAVEFIASFLWCMWWK